MKVKNRFCSALLLLSTCCFGDKVIELVDRKDETESVEIQSKCFEPEYTITSARDLMDISDCTVIPGNVHVSAFDSDILYLGSIQEINGDLRVENCSSLVAIDAQSLNTVGGVLELNTLNSLTALSFPRLESVKTLKWQVLPILTVLNLDSGIKQISSIIMSDTSLTGFGGFNVDTLATLIVNNNRYLEKIESTVTEIPGRLLIAANAHNVEVSLPFLTSVKDITIKDAETIDLGSLQVVEQNADFSQNRFALLDLPNITSVGKTLSIAKNNKLKQVNFDNLSEVGGGLMVIDNDLLKNMDFFSSLKSVGGAIEFHGDIDSNHFNGLKLVKGSAILKSSSQNFDCTDWMRNEVGRVVRGGKIECGTGKSSTTEVLMVDESGLSVKGEPGLNQNTKNISKISSQANSGAGASTGISPKVGLVCLIYTLGIILQLI